MDQANYPIVVIGAGAGGLVVAIGAAKAGKKVLLIERGTYGGDCTNFGCIPSKSLIAAAHIANCTKEGPHLGLSGSTPFSEKKEALERVRKIVNEVRSHEDPQALEKIGVETITGKAEFVDAHHLKVGDTTIYGKNIVIAAGSAPNIPDIKGLSETPFLTNETVFDLQEVPKSLGVLGGGPIGCELAQAFARLGSRVTLVHRRPNLLKKEEPEASQVVAETFEKEGISLVLNHQTESVSFKNDVFTVCVKDKADGKQSSFTCEKLLISVGRKPNALGLSLEKAGIKFTEKGIPTDIYGRTNRKHIYAIGDVTGGPAFTHAAENQGRTVLATLLLPGIFKKKRDLKQPVPRVTYTDPEVASFGMLEEEALEKFGPKKIAVYNVPLTENDRAITASRTEGFVKVVTKKWNSKILGATIVAPRAGEMLLELQVAQFAKLPLRKLASLIHPYPTYSLAIRRAADKWLTQTFLPMVKR